MAQHRVIVPAQDAVLLRERRIGQPPLRAEPGDDLGDEPRPAIAAAANHDPVGAGFRQGPVDLFQARDIAIDDDRDRNCLLDRADKAPIGLPGVKLTARAAVHRDHADAAGFGDFGESRRVAVIVVPARAHLEGDRQIDGLNRGFEDARGMQFVAHQGRAGMAVDDLFDRAAEIDVDKRRATIRIELGRLGHDPRLAAGELDGHRLLLGAALRHREGLARLADRRLAGDHLRDDKRGPLLLDDAAERQIGHPGHRRQDDRVFKCDRAEANAHGLCNLTICLKNRHKGYRKLCCTAIDSARRPSFIAPSATTGLRSYRRRAPDRGGTLA